MKAADHMRANPRVPIVIALIGLVGTLGAALIANWDKLFSPKATVVDSTGAIRPAEHAASPEQAVRELLAAWQAGNRSAASSVADAPVVDRLFAAAALRQSFVSRDITCYVVGTGQRDCQIPQSGGSIIAFRLTEADRGWRIVSVEY